MLRPTAVLFVLSTAFPIAASLLPEDGTPRWLGLADVAVAFGLMAAGLAVVARQPGPFNAAVLSGSLRILRLAASVFLVLLIVFFVTPDAVRWHVLLPGLAWRAWLFVLVLPSWLALAEAGPAPPRPSPASQDPADPS